MATIIAIAHIFGAIITQMILSLVLIFFAEKESERNQKELLNNLSISLNIPIEELEYEEHDKNVGKFFHNRYSSELLINRFSDLCGLIQSAIGVFSQIIQIVSILLVIWLCITESSSKAIYAWAVIGIWLMFYIPTVIFAFLCKTFTGRFPGEAKNGRKFLEKIALRNVGKH